MFLSFLPFFPSSANFTVLFLSFIPISCFFFQQPVFVSHSKFWTFLLIPLIFYFFIILQLINSSPIFSHFQLFCSYFYIFHSYFSLTSFQPFLSLFIFKQFYFSCFCIFLSHSSNSFFILISLLPFVCISLIFIFVSSLFFSHFASISFFFFLLFSSLLNLLSYL
jgi:hypothetical protein